MRNWYRHENEYDPSDWEREGKGGKRRDERRAARREKQNRFAYNDSFDSNDNDE